MDNIAEAIQRLIEHSGITGLDPVEMVIQITATLILIVVVKYFFWDKVTAFIEKRREIVDNELTEATEQNAEAKQLKNEAEQTFDEAKQEAKGIVDEAKSSAEDQKRDIIKAAKKEAEQIKKNAQRDLAREIEVARGKMRNEIIDIATVLTRKTIDKELSEDIYDKLIDEAIDEVGRQ